MWRVAAVVMLGATLWAVALVGAQEPPEDCDLDTIQADLSALVMALAEAEDPLAALGEINAAVMAARGGCYGWRYSSEADGLRGVIGPLTLDVGVYLATLTTEDYYILEGTVMSGDCDDYDFSMGLSEGEASDGAQFVWEIPEDGCEVLFAVDLVDEAWTLELEKIR